MVTKVLDRRTGGFYEEPQFAQSAVRILYRNKVGLALARGLICRRWFSSMMAWPSTRPRSAKAIPDFVDRFGIVETDYPQRTYSSFADFFTRTPLVSARPIDEDPTRLICPADSKVMVYRVGDSESGPPPKGTPVPQFTIKAMTYTVDDLTAGRAHFTPTWCLVFRLTVDDCHRYCFVDDTQILQSYEIPGKLHTVGPYSTGKAAVLAENHRIVSCTTTRHFGPMVVIEVGALLVGRIVNHPIHQALRGQEKGYFAYGGSTIVLLTGDLDIDEDILAASTLGIETRVRMGESMGGR